jgi:hypothetical protein
MSEYPMDRNEHRVRIFDGLWVGLRVAKALSIYAIVLFGAIGLVGLCVDPSGFPKYCIDMCWTLTWVVGGYLVACSLAGMLWAGLSWLPHHPITHAMIGFGAGAAMYGVVGIACQLEESKSPDWGFTVKVAVGIGSAWGAIAGIWSMWHRRRLSRHAAR